MITHAAALEAAENALRKAEANTNLKSGSHWLQVADRWMALAGIYVKQDSTIHNIGGN